VYSAEPLPDILAVAAADPISSAVQASVWLPPYSAVAMAEITVPEATPSPTGVVVAEEVAITHSPREDQEVPGL
jgi:hypothetical protein